MGSIKFHAIDLGGHTRGDTTFFFPFLLFFLLNMKRKKKKKARRLWKDYLQNADCVVYVIDAAERSRFDESRAELAVRSSLFDHNLFLLLDPDPKKKKKKKKKKRVSWLSLIFREYPS